jgi:hypothetical protein
MVFKAKRNAATKRQKKLHNDSLYNLSSPDTDRGLNGKDL